MAIHTVRLADIGAAAACSSSPDARSAASRAARTRRAHALHAARNRRAPALPPVSACYAADEGPSQTRRVQLTALPVCLRPLEQGAMSCEGAARKGCVIALFAACYLSAASHATIRNIWDAESLSKLLWVSRTAGSELVARVCVWAGCDDWERGRADEACLDKGLLQNPIGRWVRICDAPYICSRHWPTQAKERAGKRAAARGARAFEEAAARGAAHGGRHEGEEPATATTAQHASSFPLYRFAAPQTNHERLTRRRAAQGSNRERGLVFRRQRAAPRAASAPQARLRVHTQSLSFQVRIEAL